MLTKTARRGIPVVVLAAAGLALTACGPNDASSSSDTGSSSAATHGNDASNGKTGSGSSAASSSGSGSSGGSGSSSSGSGTSGSSGTQGKATSAPGGPAACATSQLKTTTQSTNSAAGHTGFQIVFQNTGSQPCSLTGYPGVSFVKAHNTQLGKAAVRTAGSTKTVTLLPNGHAWAEAETINGQGGYSAEKCDLTNVPTLRVYPPNQKESTNIPWNKDECVGSTIQNLRVGPVHGNR